MKSILQEVYYFKTHQAHVQYWLFKHQGILVRSGMVESAYEQLIQQRIKGVKMPGVSLGSLIS